MYEYGSWDNFRPQSQTTVDRLVSLTRLAKMPLWVEQRKDSPLLFDNYGKVAMK